MKQGRNLWATLVASGFGLFFLGNFTNLTKLDFMCPDTMASSIAWLKTALT